MNPYHAPAPTACEPLIKPQWRLRFLLLNGFLIAMPKILLLGSYLWIRLRAEGEQNPLTGDPVIFQQYYVWLEADVWTWVVYFLIPNVILIGIYLYWSYGQRRLKFQ
jgi:hypothetical protein